ncbi:P2 family phage major capsid protein [Escherichia coli]|nr:P2 family phage major capsid protein [Escherichia coli]
MTVKAKRFRIGVEGATTDGREIQREWLEQMAASYNPAVYTALINLEHIKSYLPDSTFNRYGKVTALFAEEITEGPLAGRMALYHVMGSTTTGGETTPGAVKVGKGGEYANLDAVVMDAVNELIDVVYQDDDDLVVICGRELLSDKYFPLVNKEQENSEKLAADMIISQKRMGGLQAVRAPFFPPNALLITRLDNLSIYWQEDTRRRSVIDNPKRDRIENFESVNEAYVVEDYRCAALVENIQIGDFSAAAAEIGA